MRRISKKRVISMVDKGAILVDMRSPVEFRDGSVPKAINLPLRNFVNKIMGMERSQKIIIFSNSMKDSDLRSACNYAEQLGFENIYVTEYSQLEEKKGV